MSWLKKSQTDDIPSVLYHATYAAFIDSIKEKGLIPRWSFYSSDDIQRTLRLAEEIKTSGEINPLIVEVNDQDDLNIIEGGHRLGALSELGLKSFPALVVVDLSD